MSSTKKMIESNKLLVQYKSKKSREKKGQIFTSRNNNLGFKPWPYRNKKSILPSELTI